MKSKFTVSIELTERCFIRVLPKLSQTFDPKFCRIHSPPEGHKRRFAAAKS
jgi:hypothetical protein